MSSNVTRLPCETYRTDIPASLRGLADQIEKGEAELPESMTIVTSGKEGMQVYSQGMRADDDIFTIGLLEMAKGLVIAKHADDET